MILPRNGCRLRKMLETYPNEEIDRQIVRCWGGPRNHRQPDRQRPVRLCIAILNQLALLESVSGTDHERDRGVSRYDSSVQMTGRVTLEDIDDLGNKNIPRAKARFACSVRRTATRRSIPTVRTGSTSRGPMCARCRSAAAFTSASARNWRVSRPKSRSRPCCGACRICGSRTRKIRNGGRPSFCVASSGCRPVGDRRATLYLPSREIDRCLEEIRSLAPLQIAERR